MEEEMATAGIVSEKMADIWAEKIELSHPHSSYPCINCNLS